MEPYLAWAILGLALAIVELFTGTFYLLMLGIAAFGAALAAFLGFGFAAQSVVAAAVAAAGAYVVHVYRARNAAQQMKPVDAGQPASFERWLDEKARLARVRYRGASWDARIEGDAMLEPGAHLYVVAAEGNTLRVSARYPG
jgi:membrane protein implicated in regulation of membrane protease activity